MTVNKHPKDTGKRYLVETSPIGAETWTTILETNDQERAENTANFWDERQDVRFTDLHTWALTATPAAVAEAKLNAAQTKLHADGQEDRETIQRGY